MEFCGFLTAMESGISCVSLEKRMEIIASKAQMKEQYEKILKDAKLHRASDYEDAVCCILEGDDVGKQFAFNGALSFRRGEVTLWGGINGHGKSLLMGQLALQLMKDKLGVAIMSFEMPPKRTLLRMIRQSLGHMPTVYEVGPWLKEKAEKLVLLDQVGAIESDELFGAMQIAVEQCHCEHIVVDNLMKVVRGTDDYTAQKLFVQELMSVAQALGCHVHLVHHVRKGGSEDEELTKFSFKGAGEVVDQVDNAVLIQRNRAKETKREKGVLTPAEDESEADTVLLVCKQRNGDWEGRIPLWFDKASAAFCKNSRRVPEL